MTCDRCHRRTTIAFDVKAGRNRKAQYCPDCRSRTPSQLRPEVQRLPGFERLVRVPEQFR